MEQRVWLVEKPRGDFQQVELPRPTLAKDQVLVRIFASAVNPLDIKIRQGSALRHRLARQEEQRNRLGCFAN